MCSALRAEQLFGTVYDTLCKEEATDQRFVPTRGAHGDGERKSFSIIIRAILDNHFKWFFDDHIILCWILLLRLDANDLEFSCSAVVTHGVPSYESEQP